MPECPSLYPDQSEALPLDSLCVMVQAQVGKEFPDMRQNEREIKFVRLGDAVRTVGQLEGELMLNRGS